MKKRLSSLLSKIPPSKRLPIAMGVVTVVFLIFFIIDFLGIQVLPSSDNESDLTPTPTEIERIDDEEERRGEDEEDIVVPTQQTRTVPKAPAVSTAIPTQAVATPPITATPEPTKQATPTPVQSNTPTPTVTVSQEPTPTDTPPEEDPTPTPE